MLNKLVNMSTARKLDMEGGGAVCSAADNGLRRGIGLHRPAHGKHARHQGLSRLRHGCARDVVDTINEGRIHIEEPDLDILVRSAVNSGQLKAVHEPQPADVFILCVPTPIRPDHSPDLSYIHQAARAIRPHVQPGNLIILESTSPPRTTEEMVLALAVPRR